jgi:serine/threonine protein kinase
MPKTREKIADRFETVKEIGRGSFSRVYLALDQKKRRKCALKYETMRRTGHAKLGIEKEVYEALEGRPGIARIYWTGSHGKDNVMAMQLLGPSLNDLFDDCEREFSMKTIALLADQIIRNIEQVHAAGYIHRDIKPGNFAVGRGSARNEVFVIDFGLAKRYKDPKTDKHIPSVKGKKFVGTPRYGSINAHMGKEQSRRDDLESIGYMLAYFYLGCLPWHGIEVNDKVERNKRFLQAKQEWKRKILKILPWPLRKYLEYVHDLEFEEKPDYRYLRGLFRVHAKKSGFEYDDKFEWCE